MYATSLLLLGLLAQSTDPAANAPAANAQSKAKAQELLTEGSALYEKGDYAEALEKFKQAFATYDSPKLLFNIGQANRDLGRPVEARAAFEQFLIGAHDAAPETIEDAKKSVDELEKKLGRLRVECQAENATISLDGKDMGLTPLTKLLWATPGPHQVTARHWNFSPALENVEVRVGVVLPVRIVLQAVPAKALGPQASHPESAVGQVDLSPKEPKSTESTSGWWMGRTWTWVAVGSAALFSAGAGAAGLAMQSKYDSLNKACGSATSARPGCSESDINAVATRRNAANVMWALAGASAVTAGILFFVEGHPVTVTPLAGETLGFAGSLRY
jgi:tetratricopeptide (TPR) repeat protein